jgi:broad specificity phosphatase PhoE
VSSVSVADLAQLVADLQGSGVGRLVLLMRHGAREYDREHPEREPFLPLTERGRSEARAFGERLSVPTARLQSSPVGRCRETAELVGQGAAERGARIEDEGVQGHLGAFFIKDLGAVVRACIERGVESVFTDWVRGVGHQAHLMDPDQAFEQLLTPLLASLEESQAPTLTACVTHDANIYLARARCFQDDAWGLGPVRYLDGMVLFRDGAELYAASPQLEPRRVNR